MSAAPLTVVVGPRTRLGRELVARAVDRGEPVVAVARHQGDVDALTGSGADVVLATDSFDTAGRDVRVLVCALGPIHPADPGTPVDQAADSAAVDRDLGVVEAVVAAASSARVVLVSTVIALAPGADRRYYGGWKGVVEHELHERAHQHGADVSVLYPGRLIARTSVSRPWHRAYTRYDRLAQTVEKAAGTSPTSRVVGIDARVWLLMRGLAVMFGSVSGSAGTPAGLTTRPRDPRTTSEEIPV